MKVKILTGLILLLSFCSFASDSQNYILGAGDKIEIKVFGQPDLDVTSLLGNSGEINYPFLGKVKLVGLSVAQVEQTISEGLQPDYLVNPNVYAQVIDRKSTRLNSSHVF